MSSEQRGLEGEVQTGGERDREPLVSGRHRIALDGGVDVSTTNSPVSGEDLRAERVKVRTSNDRIELGGLDVESLDAVTSNDRVLASFVAPPRQVGVRTSNDSVEIVLPRRHLSLYRAAEREEADEPETPKAPLEPHQGLPWMPRRRPGGKRGKGTGWKLANLVRAGTSLGSAIAGNRALGREDRTLVGTLAFFLVGLALTAGFFPVAVGWFIAAVVQAEFALLFGFLGLLGDNIRIISERTRRTPLVIERERVNFPPDY